MSDRRMPTLFQRPDRIAHPLYVVTTIFNSPRYRSRWRLYEDFAKRVAEAGAILYTVEVAFGDRAHAITDPSDPHHIQLRTDTTGENELWLKENAINVGVSRLPSDWKYVAWVDSDVRFLRDDWANETLHQLQHYAMIQMWSQFQDLNSDNELIGMAHGFMSGYVTNWQGWSRPKTAIPPYPYPYPSVQGKQYPGAPGLAWASRRDAWDTLDGGLLDVSVLGAGDYFMAYGLVGMLDDHIVSPAWHPRYREILYEWQSRALLLHKNVGVMPGLAVHFWHGPKSGRKYATREQIFTETQFNPDTDLRRDWQGIYHLNVHDARTQQLRNRLRDYFAQRNEDQM